MRPEILLVGPVTDHIMTELERDFVVHRLYEAADRDAFLGEIGGQVRGIATRGDMGADAELMGALPNLEIVSCYGVGVDGIDLAHAAGRGIAVTNTPNVLNDDVSNLAIALMLATTRAICAGDRHVRSAKWLEGAMPLGRSLRGKKLGILGLGRIGKEIARKAEVFGCDIAYHGRNEQADQTHRYFADLVEMAAWCDLLVCICPGGAETEKLVDRPVMDAIGPQGILINVARGAVVDEPELVKALQEGRLGGAGLDVFVDEPRVPEPLLAMENVVLQPHRGSATVETRRAMGDLTVENLRAHFAGRPLLTPVTD